MRLISGKFKGRTIKAPQGQDTRPTTDRVRESITSSLLSRYGSLEGASVLDAFAGSGALGLECLSRGASYCTFCDRSKKAVEALRCNVSDLGLDGSSVTIRSVDVIGSGIPHAASPYDIVLLDPPYRYDAKDVLSIIDSAVHRNAIDARAIIVYEYSSSSISRSQSAYDSYGFNVLSHKKYGSTCVDILERETTEQEQQ